MRAVRRIEDSIKGSFIYSITQHLGLWVAKYFSKMLAIVVVFCDYHEQSSMYMAMGRALRSCESSSTAVRGEI